MKKELPLERTLKRSEAAEVLGVTAKTLRRYELEGRLTPIKRNSRSTYYFEHEVRELNWGKR